jgi:hypothetical protein
MGSNGDRIYPGANKMHRRYLDRLPLVGCFGGNGEIESATVVGVLTERRGHFLRAEAPEKCRHISHHIFNLISAVGAEENTKIFR